MFWLACCAPLRVTAEVDEEDIARVAVGQNALLRTDAFPGRVLTARWPRSRPRAIRFAQLPRAHPPADAPAVDATPLHAA